MERRLRHSQERRYPGSWTENGLRCSGEEGEGWRADNTRTPPRCSVAVGDSTRVERSDEEGGEGGSVTRRSTQWVERVQWTRTACHSSARTVSSPPPPHREERTTRRPRGHSDGRLGPQPRPLHWTDGYSDDMAPQLLLSSSLPPSPLLTSYAMRIHCEHCTVSYCLHVRPAMISRLAVEKAVRR